MKENQKEIEYAYEKLRAILTVLDECPMGSSEKDSLIWIARGFAEELGGLIGIEERK